MLLYKNMHEECTREQSITWPCYVLFTISKLIHLKCRFHNRNEKAIDPLLKLSSSNHFCNISSINDCRVQKVYKDVYTGVSIWVMDYIVDCDNVQEDPYSVHS